MRKIIIFILLILFLSLAGACLAQRPLEVDYPRVGNYEITKTTVEIGNYIKYIYFFAIAISGLIGLGVLIWAGFRYMTSSGNPEGTKDAKDWITKALVGILIIFLSWIIANTINPKLTVLEMKSNVPFIADLPRGVVLCERQVGMQSAWTLAQEYKGLEASDENIENRERIKKDYELIMKDVIKYCISRTGAVTGLRRDFKYAYLVPTEKRKYGTILFEKPDFGGKLQIFMPNRDNNPTEKPIALGNVSSMYSFALDLNPDPSWSVTLYSEENFNYGLGRPCVKYSTVKYSTDGGDSGPCDSGTIPWIKSSGLGVPDFSVSSLGGKSPESIRIEGNLMVVLIKEEGISSSDPGFYTVKKGNDPSLLNDDAIITWEHAIPEGENKDRLVPVAAAKKMYIISYSTSLEPETD